MKIADFDGVTYRVSTPDTKSILHVSMSLRCFQEVRQYGADAILAREYGDLLASTPEPGYDVTLRIDMDNLPADKGRDSPCIYLCYLLVFAELVT